MTIDREGLLYSIAVILTDQPRLPMEQLARKVGVSRATLHRMFPSREAILFAVQHLAHAVAGRAIEAAQPERGPADEALARLVEKSMPDAALHLLLARNRNETGNDTPENDVRWEPYRQRLLSLFRRGQEAGLFRVDLSAQWMLDAMAALMFAAAEAIRAGRLAPADGVAAVVGMLLDGSRRR